MADENEAHKSAHPKKRAMLAALALTGNVTAACQKAKVGRRTHYEWVADDEEYAAAVHEAMNEAGDRLEEEARRRAETGVVEPVYGRVGKDQDGKIGTVRKYSDTLLIFLLKGAKPDKYRERAEVKHTGRLEHEHRGKVDLSVLSVAELEALGGIADKLAGGEPAGGPAGD